MSTDTKNQLQAASNMDIEMDMNPQPISFLEITQEERSSFPPTPGTQLKDHFQRCMRRHEETCHPILVMTDVDKAERAFELWEASDTGGRIEVVDGSLYLFEFNSESHCSVSRHAASMFNDYWRDGADLEDRFIYNVGAGTVTTADNRSGKGADERFIRLSPRNDPRSRLRADTTTVVIEVGDCQSLANHSRTTGQAGKQVIWCPICLLEKAHRWIHQNRASLVMMIKLYGENDPSTKNGDPGKLICLMIGERGVFHAASVGSIPPEDIQRLNEYNRAHFTGLNAQDIDIQQINAQEGAELEIEGHLIYGMDGDPRPHLNTIIADASQPPDGIEEDEINISIRESQRRATQALYTRLTNNGGTFPPCMINVNYLYQLYYVDVLGKRM